MPYTDPKNQKRAARKHYDANKDICVAKAAASNKRIREEMRALIHAAKDRPCADCGVRYPYYVMQFDHLADKEFTISRRPSGSFGYQRMVKEIAKCEVVCANCHAERTFQRTQERSESAVEVASSPRDLTLF